MHRPLQREGAAGRGDEGGRRRRFAGRRGQRHERRADHPQRERGAWAGRRSQAMAAFPSEGAYPLVRLALPPDRKGRICEVGIVAMGGSAHHYLAVDAQLRQVLGWFGALVAPTGVYLTGADFRDGMLTSESARKDLVALADTPLMLLRRLDPALLGPPPLAAKFT